MGFVLRWAFRLSLVLLLVPLGGQEGGGKVDLATPMQAVFAAREAFSDLSSICERKPEVCESGRAAFETVKSRAKCLLATSRDRRSFARIQRTIREAEREFRKAC